MLLLVGRLRSNLLSLDGSCGEWCLICHSVDTSRAGLPVLVGGIGRHLIVRYRKLIPREGRSQLDDVWILLYPVVDVHQCVVIGVFRTLHQRTNVNPTLGGLNLQLEIRVIRISDGAHVIAHCWIYIEDVFSWKENSSSDRADWHTARFSLRFKRRQLWICSCHSYYNFNY